ncbi:MAG: arylamine N-acetyltransferase [Planctomycetota bacterium]|jgi:arylamine N-acetyltransferase|nr:arylamine N-acetyltransferase [Planctomycetota bacterium]MDP6507203.1 arylamine N-acetyltransferase [Planctomycetota bacterium]
MTEAQAVDEFVRAARIPSPSDSIQFLREFLDAFQGINYENVTKILSFAEHGRLLRTAEILVTDLLESGTGGTCFSLTWLAYRTLEHLGLNAHLVMGDRRYGENTHCALVCEADSENWLLDIGFLVFDPILMKCDSTTKIKTALNTFELVPTKENLFEAHTTFRGSRKHRFTIKTERVENDTFLLHWEKSFDFDMMEYPLVTRIIDGRQHYLQGLSYQTRTEAETVERELTVEEAPEFVNEIFGIDSDLTARAYEITN